MAGGHMKYRHLSRNSAHRQSLLRNMVTSLFKHEAITTTWAKAKEAQRIAEKLVTLGKRNTSAAKRRAGQIFFEPQTLVPRLFETIAPRYTSRPGGYTRCLRLGPRAFDAADGAILSLVDGPKDMRYFMTAQTVARDRLLGVPSTAITMLNVRKCCHAWRRRVDRMKSSGGSSGGGGDIGATATSEGEQDAQTDTLSSSSSAEATEEAMQEATHRFEDTVQWFIELEKAERTGRISVQDPTAERGHEALTRHRVPDGLYPNKPEKVKSVAPRIG